MGRRYQAILKFLRVDFKGIDLGDKLPDSSSFDSVLICTPTDHHLTALYELAGLKLPILCEKPFAKDLDRVLAFCDVASVENAPIRMVNQYAELDGMEEGRLTSYDYWNSGKDGLGWDHISLIGLARGPVRIGTSSPLWNCTLNGRQLYASEMDFAYIDMIRGWLDGKVSDIPYIREAHTKVAAFLEAQE